MHYTINLLLHHSGVWKVVVMSTPSHPRLDTPYQRLRFAREQAGFTHASDAARAIGVGEPTYLGHENGSRGLSRAAARHARFFRVSLALLVGGAGGGRP